ncbi:MAG: response regulator [Pseudomonadota bacterium]
MSDARCRILLAEDEQSIVASLTFLLERAGFEVAVEPDGAKVVARALAEQPALVLLDVMMPGIDGFEALRRLRADPAGRSLPVIMLTAKGQREDRETAIHLGADHFITKPFANSDVVDAARRLAAGRQGAGAKGGSANGAGANGAGATGAAPRVQTRGPAAEQGVGQAARAAT